MKRELIQNVMLIPLSEDDTIDRSGFLSAVVAVKPKASGDITLKVTHSDTKENGFTDIKDTGLFVDGSNSVSDVESGDLVSFDLDLIGSKQYIKVAIEGTGKGEGAAFAIVLGDAAVNPVEATVAVAAEE